MARKPKTDEFQDSKESCHHPIPEQSTSLGRTTCGTGPCKHMIRLVRIFHSSWSILKPLLIAAGLSRSLIKRLLAVLSIIAAILIVLSLSVACIMSFETLLEVLEAVISVP